MSAIRDAQALLPTIQALGPGRQMIAIAGPPASGKSSLAEALTEALCAAGEAAVLVPMDGFHLDNRLLEPRGLLPRKGAPETFDAHGFVALIQRLRNAEGGDVVYPVFDRSREIAIAGAGVVRAEDRLVIVEGNYLLLKDRPWDALRPLWDVMLWRDPGDDVLRQRLIQRWQAVGLSPDEIERKVAGNDLPNARLIRDRSTLTGIVDA